MNKVVLITGASRGIGRDIAEKLAQKGYQVIANYNRSEEKAKELKSKYKDYLDTVPFKDLFIDLENVTDMLKTRRGELVDIHKSLDENYKLTEMKIKKLAYN